MTNIYDYDTSDETTADPTDSPSDHVHGVPTPSANDKWVTIMHHYDATTSTIAMATTAETYQKAKNVVLDLRDLYSCYRPEEKFLHDALTSIACHFAHMEDNYRVTTQAGERP